MRENISFYAANFFRCCPVLYAGHKAVCGQGVARELLSAMNRDIVFSIIIANYNYGAYVGDAIASALDQDWPHVEVIVVDDGSTDESAAVIAAVWAGRESSCHPHPARPARQRHPARAA